MSPLVLLAHFTIIKSKLIEKDWPIKSTYLMIQNNDRRCSRVPKRSVRQGSSKVEANCKVNYCNNCSSGISLFATHPNAMTPKGKMLSDSAARVALSLNFLFQAYFKPILSLIDWKMTGRLRDWESGGLEAGRLGVWEAGKLGGWVTGI